MSHQVAKSQRVAIAFPELRCTFGESPSSRRFSVPVGQNSSCTSGRVNRFEIHPDWAIEILSLTRAKQSALLTCSIALHMALNSAG